MDLIDTHCHLTSDALAADAAAVIARAVAAGVGRMITVATDAADARAARALARRHPELRIAAGIHPHDAARAGPADLDALAQTWTDPLCVAAGEMGLDYHYDFSPRDAQHDLFARQLERAAPTGLPIVVHSREAHADTVAMLERAGYRDRPVVFHCFTGSADEAADVAAHGWRISFTGVVTFRKSEALHAIAASYPAEHLMIETDSPYLSPEPVRHVRPNEPAHLVHTATFLARLRGTTPDTIAAQTTAAAEAFFGLTS